MRRFSVCFSVYDVYYPKKFNGVDIDYSTCRLPAVIFAHSGGFSDCSSKDQPGIATYGTEFAKRGFIFFSCEYRREVQLDFNNRVYTSVQQEIGMYRACQDVRGAIRTIIQKHGTYNGSFRINVNSIFLAGNSAGSFAMLNAAYYPNPNKVYPLFPNLAKSSVTIQDAAGKIDADFYDCDSSIPYIDNIKGLLNCWGSISLPSSYFNNESSYFPANQNHPSVISFHGLLDTVFPPTSQNVRFAPASGLDAPFNSESRCLKTSPFAAPDGLGSIILKNYGSLDIVSRVLIPLNVFYEVYIDSQMAHGLDKDGPNYASDFGTGATNTTDTIIYIVKRAATFFQAILNGIDDDLRDTSSIHHCFYDCENRRKQCNISNNPNNCGETSCS